jgi:YVTN family beta-propeller protein
MRNAKWLLAGSLWLLSSFTACKKPPEPTPAPQQPAVAPHKGVERVYVSAEQSGEVVVVDPQAAQVVARIAVGKRPRGLKVGLDGKLYVAKSGSPRGGPNQDESQLPPADRAADGIGVIDLASAKLVGTLPGGQDPETFDITPDGRTLYIANEETAELSQLDLATGKITARIPVGRQPEGVSVRPDGAEVWVTCEEDNEVVAVDARAGKVIAHIPVGKRPRAIAWSADGHTAYVTNELDGSVSRVDAQAHELLESLPLSDAALPEQRPMGILRLGERLFVSTGRGAGIAELQTSPLKRERTLHPVGARPWGIAQSPDGKRLYTANGPSNDLTIVDLETGQQKHVEVGGSPWGVVAVLQ